MIPKGGRFAKSVVNFVHKVPENWGKFKSAIQQIEGLLKQGKLKLDGKQKTIFETNKNILKNHEKVTKKVEVPPPVKKPEDYFKGWTPNVITGGKGRNVPPTRLYTKEMERIDDELDELVFGDKYNMFSDAEKAALFKQLQANMKKLIDKAMKDDLATLSLSEINKKSHALQKRIREIADNPNIEGTVSSGPKRDMIEVIYKEREPLDKARQVITKRNSELKYGKKYPVLDPENDAFIVLGLDERGNPIKISRFTGKFSATKDSKTGDLTSAEGTSFYDKWNAKTGTFRKEGEEVFHETLNRDGKVIMSNPEYKLPKTQRLDIQTEFYTDLSTRDLFKKGYKLKDIDMIVKGRKVREYLDKTKSKDTSISMHEQTSTNEIGAVMEDLYHRGDDVYKMSIEEWVKKIPEYFAGGGRVAYGEGTGGISNFFKNKLQKYTREGIGEAQEKWLKEKDLDMTLEEWQAKDLLEKLVIAGKLNLTIIPGVDDLEKGVDYASGGIADFRQGYRDAGSVIKLAKGARWLLRMLKEMSDDMIFGHGKFANMAESLKMKYFKQTEAAIKSLEAGGPIPDEILTSLRQDPRFKNLTVSKGGDKDFIEMQEVVLGKTTKGTVVDEKVELFAFMNELPKETQHMIAKLPIEKQLPYLRMMKESKKGTGEKLLEGTVVEEIDLMAFKKELPADIIANLEKLPMENQTILLTRMKKAFDMAKKGGVESGTEVLQKQLLEDFIPKGKPHATGGLIDGYATGGVSNLFRRR